MSSTADHQPPQVDGATASVSYHLPAPALREAITTYYLVKVAGSGVVRDQIFPEWPNFRMILSGDWTADFPSEPTQPVPVDGATGALERAVWVEGTAGLMVGVGLMPQGWRRFTDLPADDFTNRMRPLADVLGPAADDLHARLVAAAPQGDVALYAVLDEILPGLLRPAQPQAQMVGQAHRALQDPEVQTVAQWADTVCLSARQLERFCRRYLGLSPKRLLRRQRLLRTLAAMRDAPAGGWTQFLDDQYADQAHFIHEFNYYMGMTPKAYVTRVAPFMAEAWKRRKELLGSPVQVLQPPSKPPQ
jgi:AraC-like DNA-binding protein